MNCSINTAPSSPGRLSLCSNQGEDCYFSEPTSPTHFLSLLLQSSDSDSGKDLTRSVNSRNEYFTAQNPKICKEIKASNGGGGHVSSTTSFEFEFSSRHSEMAGDQPFAEELFFNGQIRPLNQQTKSQYLVSPRPPLSSGPNIRSVNAPADDDESDVVHGASKGKDDEEYTPEISKRRSTSLRNFLWEKSVKEDRIHQEMKGVGKMKAESHRHSCGRSSKSWRLKDFLERSSSSSSNRKRGKDMLWRLPSLNIPPAEQAQKHSMKNLNRFNKSNGMRVSAYSAHELRCKEKKGEDETRRRSFLRCARGVLGHLMNGLTGNLHPFSAI